MQLTLERLWEGDKSTRESTEQSQPLQKEVAKLVVIEDD